MGLWVVTCSVVCASIFLCAFYIFIVHNSHLNWFSLSSSSLWSIWFVCSMYKFWGKKDYFYTYKGKKETQEGKKDQSDREKCLWRSFQKIKVKDQVINLATWSIDRSKEESQEIDRALPTNWLNGVLIGHHQLINCLSSWEVRKVRWSIRQLHRLIA